MLFGDRYEAAWGSLRSQSESVTLRTEQLAKTVEQASARCGAACDGLERLHGELEQLPACAKLLEDMTARVGSACGRIESLEARLAELTEANAREWAAARVRQEAIAKQEGLRLDALREREQAFQSEFEDQRRAFREHGDAGVRRMAPPSQPRSLADVQPDVAVADGGDVDSFYDS